MSNYLKINGVWREVSKYYQKSNGAWAEISKASFDSYISVHPAIAELHEDTNFSLGGPSNISGVSCSFTAIYDGANVTTAATWSLISGSQYASLSGEVLTIGSNANDSTITIQAVYNGVTATKDVVITYKTGTTGETQTETVVDESGNTSTTTTIVIDNGDGSSSSASTTVVVDENGNTVGTTESEVTNNADGSFNGTSTSYDASGNPTETVNQSGDTTGNIETQQVSYNESGSPVVTGYEIDTTGSEGAGRSISGDGVNTEFIPFADDNCGFICRIKFTTVASQQPRPPLVEDTEILVQTGFIIS